MPIASLLTRFRSHPVATTLEVGSVVVCLLLFVMTFALLVSGPPAVGGGAGTGATAGTSETAWLTIVAVGAAFVLFWTAVVPLYERLLY